MPSEFPSPPSLHSKANILGICWLVYGVLRLIAALWLVFFSTTARLMFGATLSRVPDAFTLMHEFQILYILLVVWSVLAGLLGILAAIALLSGPRSASTIPVVASVVSLADLPLGTTLGIFTLILLLPTRLVRA